ncbi:hypothetical protein [Fredinandcohnia quinoae]|uniref:Lipoprotein n=1 Tax=Fredinandcohnia quinoae TaxID=2918902 RepID=A0AAW5DZ20_9BACI|nr:hypothetical protein [Fredinandcohnia sp. SECRCQ15]MCH1625892.1 hypothetical protein [Fredinandcohnia sp. SECRCQ15]
MQKVIILMIGTLLLAACGSNEKNVVHKEKSPIVETVAAEMPKSTESEKNESIIENSEMLEFASLEANVSLSDYQLNVVEDNPHKRIILLKNKQGQERYKSIFIKDTGELKIIEFNKGPIFVDMIGK